MSTDHTRKLIEVALPLTEISAASLADKHRKVGTIKNAHKWFAPMPTPALRALIFAALVNDPGDEEGRTDLLEFIKNLVPVDGTPPTAADLKEAMNRIARDNPELPTVMDPFCGGGSTIVEAQRLGLNAVGSDLNPIAVLITRVLGELLPPMVKTPAVSASVSDSATPQPLHHMESTPFEGLVADLRHYGRLVQDAVKQRIGGLYPEIHKGKLIASLWARTVPCPNPACNITVPLFGSPWLSKKKGREAVVEALVEGDRINFVVRREGGGKVRSTKLPGKARFECPACMTTFGEREIRAAGKAGMIGLQQMASCVELPQNSGRCFLAPSEMRVSEHEVEVPDDLDDLEIGDNRKAFTTPIYGLPRHIDLYTPRQLAMLAAFADEVSNVYDVVVADGGSHAAAKAIASSLALCIGKLAQSNSSLVRWRIDSRNGSAKAEPAFGMQTMPMLWDFAEVNPFGESVGGWTTQVESFIGALRSLPVEATVARTIQADARSAGINVPAGSALLVTDPPYFGQINYAELSDYFYLWIRRAMRAHHGDLFGTMATPKSTELVANPTRHGGSKEASRGYFIDGFTQVFRSLHTASRSDLPIVVAYAHKQDEESADGVTSSGWESLLEAVLAAGLGVVRTWPIEATVTTRQRSQKSNALASYLILICKPRKERFGRIDRAGFLHRLSEELPTAVRELKQGGISAIDLRQAAIGPGMKVFSEYAQVIENDGSRMTVRTALALIGDRLHVVLREQQGDFDRESRWCLDWFEENGWEIGEYGRAEQLSNSHNISMDALRRAGVLRKGAGDVYLIKPENLPGSYDPALDQRPTVWEAAVHLSKRLEERGVESAGHLMAGFERWTDVDAAKDLAYLLAIISQRRKWAKDALRFDNLITSWPDLVEAAQSAPNDGASGQVAMDFSAEE